MAAEPRPAASLNAAQMEAVQHLGGPCLVLAGAGSGKTRVITHKIARLLAADYQPKQIAAITFTNKAAQEMRERAKALVGPRAAKDLAISTFHSLGVRILRSHGERVGLKPQFSILDSDDVLGILRDAGGCTDNALARRWQWTISRWKNDGLTSEQADAAAADDDERVAARVMKRYEERLAAYQAVDFDDLIGLPHRLLQRDAEVREKLQDQLRYVLVDEYQDTNAIQYELLKLLAGERGLFTAVGDDDQSIYGWRGATIDNLRGLPADYPRLKVIPLEQNYRSTGSILRAANCVIGNNPKLYEKKLWSDLGEGDPIVLLECDGEEHEAERVVARIKAIREQGGALGTDGRAPTRSKWKDFAVLYRANHQARVFEKALRKATIPYKVSGGQSFFDRAEIKDLCAWLRLLVNNDDDPAFLRAVTTPKRGIGHQTLASLGEFATRWKSSLFEALFAESLGTALSARAVGSLHEFGRGINDLQYRARQTDRRRGREGAAARLAEGHRLRAAPARRRGQREARGEPLGQRARLRRLDREALRRRDRERRRRDVRDREEERARRRADDLGDRQPGRARRRAERRHPVDPARGKGPRMAARRAGRRQRGLLPFKSEDDEMTASRLEEERRLMYVGITRARSTLAISTLRRRKRGRDTIQGIRAASSPR
jgi:ATP-dependent DNA helicase Rep